jgi:hypothetical protein
MQGNPGDHVLDQDRYSPLPPAAFVAGDDAGAKMLLCSHFAPNVRSNNAIARYQKSGNGLAELWKLLVGDTGIEPVTFSVSATGHHPP